MIARLALSALLLSICCGLATQAQAASPADVTEVIMMVTDPKVPALTRDTKVLNEPAETTMTFMWDGLHYTFEYSGSAEANTYAPGGRWLAVWVSEVGKSGHIEVFDAKLDGRIDFAVEYDIAGDRVRLFALKGSVAHFQPDIGLDNEAYCQLKYDEAIAAALAYRRSVSR